MSIEVCVKKDNCKKGFGISHKKYEDDIIFQMNYERKVA